MSSHLESIVAEETAKRSQRAVLRCYAAEALFTWADLLTRFSKALFSLGVDTLSGTVSAADKTWRNVYFVAQQLNVSAFLMVLHLKWRQALAVFNTPTHTQNVVLRSRCSCVQQQSQVCLVFLLASLPHASVPADARPRPTSTPSFSVHPSVFWGGFESEVNYIGRKAYLFSSGCSPPTYGHELSSSVVY